MLQNAAEEFWKDRNNVERHGVAGVKSKKSGVRIYRATSTSNCDLRKLSMIPLLPATDSLLPAPVSQSFKSSKSSGGSITIVRVLRSIRVQISWARGISTTGLPS